MKKPYSWVDWGDDDLTGEARPDIEYMYEALHVFCESYDDVPRPIQEAYYSLQALKQYIDAIDKEQTRCRLIEWNAWAKQS